ncbi:50S ribosomal protein L24e [Candidatus Woesearchaeota archaeon]|nr:50S ribosomal protein L24e [Candidatus Woesearchaeota archaeon]
MKCSFCNNEVEKSTGTMYVKKDAKILYFCSTKCEKSMLKLNRNPRYTLWTNTARQEKKA